MVLEASTVQLDGETLTATGEVRVALPDGGLLEADGLELREGSAVLRSARWTEGSATLEADTVRWTDGVWHATALSLDPCACDTPSPLRLTAQQASALDGRVRLDKVRLEIASRTVAGLPRLRLPIERRSGLLWPTVRHGPDGWWLAQPLYLAPRPSWDLTVTPEVRTELGARGIAEARWNGAVGEGQLDGFAAWSPSQTSARGGAVQWTHRGTVSGVDVATDGVVLTAPTVLSTWGTDQVRRGTAYTEQRAWIGRGGVGVWADVFRETDTLKASAATVTPLGAHLEQQQVIWDGRGVAEVRGRAALLTGLDGAAQTDLWTDGRARLTTTSWSGPIRFDLDAGAELGSTWAGSTADERTQHVDGWGLARVVAPLWRRENGALTRIEPSVTLGGTASPQLAALVAPGLELSRVTAQHSAWGEVTVRRQRGDTHTQLRSEVRAEALQVHLTSRVTNTNVSTAEWGAEAGPSTTRLGLLAVAWRIPDPASAAVDSTLLLDRVGARGWVTLPGPLSSWRIEADALRELHDDTWPAAGLALQYTHPSGCAQLRATLRQDGDRAGPDAGLSVALFP